MFKNIYDWVEKRESEKELEGKRQEEKQRSYRG